MELLGGACFYGARHARAIMVFPSSSMDIRRKRMTTYNHLTVEYGFNKRITTVTLRRPEVHNAFNAQVIQDLISAFTHLAADGHLHGVILTGEGPSFSAGADV